MQNYEKKIILNKISNSTLFTKKIGSQLALLINKSKKNIKKNIILLEGCIGSGKTTLIKGIAKQLGIKQNINSPTFLLLKSYKGKNNKIHHLDLYKMLNSKKNSIISIIEEINEIVELGEILIIESTKNILSFFPHWDIKIKINILSLNKRQILIEQNNTISKL
ncbi:tRNA (adenosine(37)-N6)-threonylcarbamoyltransferase complex ATPase subunit type 1 TsaE ['Cynodon dactylon' phytoplasma]|uniref:tRNA (adenosine(37)-N6)-threonylcarbamoyltransferase complex ATPase subunit type 1 TsaE n=1 Tax='Cynodon dactylon' phytoplasma TaxID=295320 RepID=UPI001265BDFE|nr:tRNA (adenosine(37)-N6)-threonylcarbamoyltransferase complex ATPase subunit type 1 TsaE ['Cynodon dactylon' phytoplasma]KAB8121874.1 tRNA (adenosine(37)-N6)-threonylcarbamoyltransferase complex ATPase subunit type 1 TsaE ['Cynodon dactylon' phytoplasma]